MGRPSKARKHARALLRRTFASLGALRAEDDTRLDEYFVDSRGYLAKALESTCPALIFTGPKGVGKSAILKMIVLRNSSDPNRIIRVSPDDLAFTALAQCDLSQTAQLQNNQEAWLFKVLWQYVLCIRLLAKEYPYRQTLWDRVRGIFQTTEQRQAQSLLELAIRQDGLPAASFTDTILRLLQEIQVDVTAQGYTASTRLRLADPRGSAPSNLAVLNTINKVASNISSLLEHKYYVLIDDLDLHWQNEPLQNRFIAALFSAIRKIADSSKASFSVALRDDILTYLPIDDKDKFRDWECPLGWDRTSLRQVIEDRFRVLHNISQHQLWGALLPDGAFDAIADKSSNKPRDLIRLVQVAIEIACNNNHDAVTEDDLKAAIRTCSGEKLEELDLLWSHKFPRLRWVVDHFAGKPREFDLRVIRDVCEILALEVDEDKANGHRYTWCAGFANDARAFAWLLVEIGCLLVKSGRTSDPHRPASREVFLAIENPLFVMQPLYGPALEIKNY